MEICHSHASTNRLLISFVTLEVHTLWLPPQFIFTLTNVIVFSQPNCALVELIRIAHSLRIGVIFLKFWPLTFLKNALAFRLTRFYYVNDLNNTLPVYEKKLDSIIVTAMISERDLYLSIDNSKEGILT